MLRIPIFKKSMSDIGITAKLVRPLVFVYFRYCEISFYQHPNRFDNLSLTTMQKYY